MVVVFHSSVHQLKQKVIMQYLLSRKDDIFFSCSDFPILVVTTNMKQRDSRFVDLYLSLFLYKIKPDFTKSCFTTSYFPSFEILFFFHLFIFELKVRILEWVAIPSRGFSQPRDQTQVSRIAGGFFIP